MHLNSLSITNLRNIAQAELALAPGFNLFFGQNGSGKTSILEAVHLLASGRSFRSMHAKNIIRVGEASYRVAGLASTLKEQALRSPISLGVERFASGASKIRLAEKDCHSMAMLAKVLAIQLINSDSYDLLEADPSHRRRFMDWMMFHVEHSFHPVWQRFNRALQQRNAVLRMENTGQHDNISAWNYELVQTGQIIDVQRKALLTEFIPIFSAMVAELLGLQKEISIRYEQGWPTDYSLEAALNKYLSRDLALKYTTVGPQRADLEILIDGIPAKSLLSRGELKLFIAALLISRAVLLHKKEDRRCLFLVDDLHAELDDRAAGALISALSSLGSQVLISSVLKESVSAFLKEGEVRCFGVSAGVVQHIDASKEQPLAY